MIWDVHNYKKVNFSSSVIHDEGSLYFRVLLCVIATLPIERLRRLMPSEEQGSSSRYPIMSKYRRNNVLPDGKAAYTMLRTSNFL